jgi:hypothetical protein
MKHGLIFKIGVRCAAIASVGEAYRRHRRRQLALMPKGINKARGVTMRSAIKAARPTSIGR